MKLRKLLPISLLSLGMLVGCGPQPATPSETFPADKQDGTHTVEVTNLEALRATWYDDGDARAVEVTIKENGEEKSVPLAINQRKLSLVVEDQTVAQSSGLSLSPKAISDATKATKVAVKYYDTVVSFTVTITHRKTPKDYGASHDGTEADPLTNEDVLIVAKAQKAEGSFADADYYVKGEVHSFYSSEAPGSNKDVVSYYLKPAAGQTEKFEVYQAKKVGAASDFKWTDDDIWPGAIVTAYGKLTYYESARQYEFKKGSAFVTKIEGTKPEPPVTIEATVAQAITAAKALETGATSWDFYQVSGKVKAITEAFSSYNNMSFTVVDADTDTEVLNVYRMSCTAEQAAKVKLGASVVVKGKVSKYSDTEFRLAAAELISAEGGSDPVDIPEPTLVTGKTLAEFAADKAGNKKQLYELTAKVTKWKDENTDGTAYGNFYISDDNGTTEILIYGATATATALTWDKVTGSYTFKNPQDFLTNAMTKTIAVGKEITMKLTRNDYQGAVQGVGLVTAVEGYTPGEDPVDIPEPTLVTGKTLAEFAADKAGNKKQLYELTAKVTKWKGENTDGTAYGNFYISDDNGTTEVLVYGATATATALVWDKENGVYNWKNPQDFLTNDMTKAIEVGKEVTLKLTRSDYQGAVQGIGLVTAVEGYTPSVDPGIEGDLVVDFAAKTVSHNSYQDTWQYGDVTLAGAANNNGNWAFVKFGPKAETLAKEDYPGTWMKTDKALAGAIASVSMKFVGKCYNQDNEKASVKIEAYSDAALTTKVAETASQEVPAITTNEGTETLNFTFATPAANLYYKVVFDIYNTTTYNGVVALEKVTFTVATAA